MGNIIWVGIASFNSFRYKIFNLGLVVIHDLLWNMVSVVVLYLTLFIMEGAVYR